MRVLSALLLVIAAAIPAFAMAPGAGQEREVSPPPVTKAFFGRLPVDVAWHGEHGFVVWTDSRAGFFAGSTVGSRIDAEGRLLDPQGIPIALSTTSFSSPQAVEWVGDAWLVVWLEHGMWMRRVNAGGERIGAPVPLRPASVSITDHSISGAGHAFIATNGENALIVSFNGEAYLVSADLTTIETIDLGRFLVWSVAFDGTDYVVLGRIDNKPVAIRISPEGRVTTIDLPREPSVPSNATWTGRDYIVLSGAFDQNLTVTRVAADLSSVKSRFPLRAPFGRGASVMVVRGVGEAEAIVGWQLSVGAALARIGSGDDVGPMKSFPEWPAGQRHAFSQLGSGFILVGPGLSATLFSADLEKITSSAGPDFNSFAAQRGFSASREGTASPVVFAQVDGDRSRIMITPEPGTVAQPLVDAQGDQAFPAIASNGRSALVTWLEQAETPYHASLMTLPVDVLGHPLAPQANRAGPARVPPFRQWGVGGGTWPGTPSVVWTGHLFIVAWPMDGRIAYVRVFENGAILDHEPRAVAPAREYSSQSKPILTRVGGVTLLVWTEGQAAACNITCAQDPGRIRAVRLNSGGDLLDPIPLSIALEEYSVFADAASVGDTALIVWERHGQIFGRRVSSTGFVFDAAPISINSTHSSRPTVARHGDDFLVAWQNGAADQTELTYEIDGSIVSTAGRVGPRFRVASGTWQMEGPLAWTMESGSAALAYIRRTEASEGIPRLYFRTIDAATATRVRSVRR